MGKMDEELGFASKLMVWLSENAGWFVPLFGAVAVGAQRIHRYFSGLNRISDDVAKLTDPANGVILKKDMEAIVNPMSEHIKNTDERLNRIENKLMGIKND